MFGRPRGRSLRRGDECGLLVLRPCLQGGREELARWSKRAGVYTATARPLADRRGPAAHSVGQQDLQVAAVTVEQLARDIGAGSVVQVRWRDALWIEHLDDGLRGRPRWTDRNSYCFP